MSSSETLRELTIPCRLTFRWLGNRKSLSQEHKVRAEQAFAANRGTVSASKRLIDKAHPRIRKLTEIKGLTRSYWEAMTLPFTEKGIRLLKRVDLTFFNQAMDTYRIQMDEAIAELRQDWQQIKDQARHTLGDLYDPFDYPNDPSSEFEIHWDFPSIDAPSYLSDLSPEIYAEEKRKVEQSFREAARLAESHFIEEFSKIISHLAARLEPKPDGSRQIIHASALENLNEFFERFGRLNITSSQELQSLVTQAKELVAGTTPSDLRDMSYLRREIKSGMEKISEQLNQFVVTPKRRSIQMPTPQEAATA